jgi:two-component system, cell cycle sensor histidine kinase and response regulator CckA
MRGDKPFLGPSERIAGAMACLYALAAGLWILVSDRALAALRFDARTLMLLSTIKGWGFVAATAALLFLAIRRALERQRLTADRLTASEEKFRTLVERSLAGIYIIQDERFVYVNPRFGEIHGRPLDEIIGRPIEDFVAPEDRPRVRENVRRRLAGEIPHVRYAFQGVRSDGSRIDLEVAGVSTTLGGRPAVIGTALDQTQRNALQKQALQAQKMEILGLIAGGIVHDFNNVVSSIVGQSELLALDLPAGSVARREAEEILGSAKHASTLTRQLLTFSRGQRPELVAQDLGQAVRGCSAMLRSAAGGAVRLDVAVESGLGAFRATPGQLEQALMNLVINARDAMSGGGVVALAARRGREGFAEIVVRDAGAGMDRATLAKVFDVFFTTKAPGKGTGLGLPMVQRFAEEAGGRVEIDSAPGEGTTVRVLLPVNG